MKNEWIWSFIAGELIVAIPIITACLVVIAIGK